MSERLHSGKISWNDLHEASFKELKKTYKVNDQNLEIQVRRHLDSASMEERRDVYKTVWDKHRK